MLPVLNTTKKAKIFNIKLDEKDKLILNETIVTKDSDLTLVDIYEHDIMIEKALKYSTNLKKEKLNRIKEIIKNIIKEFININKKNNALVHLRFSTPTNSFKEPRWHTDGRYYIKQKKNSRKLVTTLLGKPTMISEDKKFYKIKDKYLLELRNTSNIEEKKKIRKKWRTIFAKNMKPIKGNYDSAYTFINSDYGTIHSEPNIDHMRIFLAVMPEDTEVIKTSKIGQNKTVFYK